MGEAGLEGKIQNSVYHIMSEMSIKYAGGDVG